jgi:nucleoside-diphosphate-sugar epimerase
MKIAFFGASSQIAKGLIKKFSSSQADKLYFFVRDKESFAVWLEEKRLNFAEHQIKLYDELPETSNLDLLINCIGAGDPAKAVNMSSTIVSVTQHYDEQVLDYLTFSPMTKYIFLSSGAAYGNIFSAPPDKYQPINLDMKSTKLSDMYAISKITAELAHRAKPQYSIMDIRIFSYFDSETSIDSRFFLTDALRSIKDKKIFMTSSQNIARDYIGVNDLYQLILKLISKDKLNAVVDAYSLAPIKKFTILETLKKNFNLKYEFTEADVGLNATGNKDNYFSKNYCAKDYGYQPSLSSKEIILKVAKTLLTR